MILESWTNVNAFNSLCHFCFHIICFLSLQANLLTIAWNVCCTCGILFRRGYFRVKSAFWQRKKVSNNDNTFMIMLKRVGDFMHYAAFFICLFRYFHVKSAYCSFQCFACFCFIFSLPFVHFCNSKQIVGFRFD